MQTGKMEMGDLTHAFKIVVFILLTIHPINSFIYLLIDLLIYLFIIQFIYLYNLFIYLYLYIFRKHAKYLNKYVVANY